MIATEVPHTLQTRGVYRTTTFVRVRDKDKNPHPRDVGLTVPNLAGAEVFDEFNERYCSSYDNCYVRISARDSWRLTRDTPFLAGEFRWSGFDYLGESPGWPAHLWNFGIIDTCGFPKDTYFFYKSQWTDKPMVHLLPHWTWPGKEGVAIPVWCYTNCSESELFLNGRSLGGRTVGERMHVSWDVPYEPGELRAIGRSGGRVVECAVATAGEPAALELTLDRDVIVADGFDVAHATVRVLDGRGVFVPTASVSVELSVTGAGRLIGMDNGDPLCHEGYLGPRRSAFGGMCLGIIQAGREGGDIAIRATSGALEAGAAVVAVQRS
jgi:beta-galactosidase